MRPLRLKPLGPLHQPLQLSTNLRTFHSTPRRLFLEPCLSLTSTLLTDLHQLTHLSWPMTIPLFALGVRVFLLPLSLRSRQTQIRLMELQPIISAYRTLYTKQVLESHRQLGPSVCQKMVAERVRAKSREIYARNSLHLRTRLLPLLQLPVFLVIIETIRRMCGTREGLLGLLAKQFGTRAEDGAIPTGPSTSEQVLVESTVPGLENTIYSTSSSTVGLEPSFALEGNWDLLSPYPALSFCLAAILYANVALPARFSDLEYKDQLVRPVLQQRVTRALKVVCLAIGPLTLQLPAAMTLYWCCSGGSALAVAVAMNLWRPLPKPVQPCRNNSLAFSYDHLPALRPGSPLAVTASADRGEKEKA